MKKIRRSGFGSDTMGQPEFLLCGNAVRKCLHVRPVHDFAVFSFVYLMDFL